MLSAAGLFATSARGAALGLAIGTVVILGARLSPLGGEHNRRTIITAIVLIVGLAAGGGLYLSRRFGSAEAAGSTAVRLETLQAGEVLVREYWPLGAGPGLADELKMSMPIGSYQRGVESSAFEIAIDLGLPGIVLTLWLFGVVIMSAIRTRPDLAACVIAYVVVASTFNLVDEDRPGLIIWGLLVGLSVRAAPISLRGTMLPLAGEIGGAG